MVEKLNFPSELLVHISLPLRWLVALLMSITILLADDGLFLARPTLYAVGLFMAVCRLNPRQYPWVSFNT